MIFSGLHIILKGFQIFKEAEKDQWAKDWEMQL